ncbi:MAG TPA: hypothetical protein H9956_04750 [Candidatus Eisenbergiella pullicola]|nr:hypothetical protein [Candidatus Eisenbergiella pullicola]
MEYINGMEVVKVFNWDGESPSGLSRMCGATVISSRCACSARAGTAEHKK